MTTMAIQDLFIANGHPDDKIEVHSTHVTYKEPLLLFHNNGRGFENVSTSAVRHFQKVSPREYGDRRL